MRRKQESQAKETHFSREYSFELDGFTIERGDQIKIRGERGGNFRFDSVVVNTKTGASWIDCFETHRGQSGCYRSFKIDQIKRIPKRRSSGTVRRRKSNTTS